MFKLRLPFELAGDQPKAVKELTAAFRAGKNQNVLWGVTGSGKTVTMSAVINNLQKPTLVVSPNKTLAAQLFQEFKDFFPENPVHYFVSYYDYYQPEAYMPASDTYIEKDSKINEEIDKLRHAATADILSRADTIVVASVSCIYGIGDPVEYEKAVLTLVHGQAIERNRVLRHLAELQYERNDLDPRKGTYRVRGDTVEIYPPAGERIYKVQWSGETIEATQEKKTAVDSTYQYIDISSIRIFPAKHFVTPRDKLELALTNVEAELTERLEYFRRVGKLLETQRLEERTRFDLEMLRETGFCHGIENYSRHLSFRKPGQPPSTLIDYFNYAYNTKCEIARKLVEFSSPEQREWRAQASANPEQSERVSRNTKYEKNGWLLMIDESHISVPQVNGMYPGDRSRKRVLVEYGFRLPSAVDNRPLTFEEFEKKIGPTLYVSATPRPYELNRARGEGRIVEQIVRPTGLLDPTIEVRPTKNQVQDLIAEIQKRVAKGQRTLITTLTKRLAEDIAEYLAERGIKIEYLHSDVKTLLRPEILNDLRRGAYDAIVGINLLREGLDLPEVSLVAILDADKEGFLRNETTLVQTMGRASRHIEGYIIMYADTVTGSMQRAITEIDRRRAIQEAHNKEHGVTPRTIQKAIKEYALPSAEKKLKEKSMTAELKALEPFLKGEALLAPKELKRLAKELEREMREAAERLEFERAAEIRDLLKALERRDRVVASAQQ